MKTKTYVKKREFLTKDDFSFYSTNVEVDTWVDSKGKPKQTVASDFMFGDGTNLVSLNVWANDNKELKKELEPLYKLRDSINVTINCLLLAGKDTFK